MTQTTGHTKVLEKTFDQIDLQSLNQLRQVARRCIYEKDTVLCQQGKVEDTFYIIVEGTVITTQELSDGKSRVIGTLGPNEYFGEMSLIDQSPRMFTCATMSETTTVLEITRKKFQQLVRESPVVAHDITKHILENLRRVDARSLRDLHKKNLALKKAYTELQVAQSKLVEKERLERELELAAELQRSLLPSRLPQFDQCSFAGYLKPARKVGGDLFDIIDLDKNHVGLLVADVADKGILAAMFMGITRTLFYTEGRRSLSPATVAESVHRGMMDVANAFNLFVTAFYGVFHKPSGQLTFVRAGHDPPFHIRHGEFIKRLVGEGRFLGMWEGLKLKEYKTKLKSGDQLVMFSDGVTDAINKDGEQFGAERLEAIFVREGKLSAEKMVQCIVGEIEAWSSETPAFDDLTLLVMDVH